MDRWFCPYKDDVVGCFGCEHYDCQFNDAYDEQEVGDE